MEQFQILPIEKVFESPLNPRKTFNQKKMAELVESIKAKGILVPLLVRPVNVSLNAMVVETKYEIAAGHRRYRAAIEVGLEEVPLIIREMNDTDFVEVLVIENDKHEDLEPLEQAQGYLTLMKEAHYDIPAIALKVSKSESYVYQRLKLLELIPEAQKQLAEEKITAGHAILIARLQPEKQKEVLEDIEEDAWHDNIMSVRDLADHIETQIHLDLNSASFSKKDPNLLPSAGPCTTCQKRTGFMPTLFPDIKKKDTCTDPKCFHAKVEAFAEHWLKEKAEDSDEPPLRLSSNYDGRMKKVPDDPQKPVPSQLYHRIENKKDRCEYVQEGIIVDGRERGQIQQICVDPHCKKHHGRGTSYTGTGDNEWRVAQKAREEKSRRIEMFRLRVIDAILPTAGDLSKQDLMFLANELFDELWDEHRKKILARHQIQPAKVQYGHDHHGPMKKHIEGCNTVDLGRLMMEMALIRHREQPHWTDKRKPDPLLETAKRYKVDVKKIEVALKAEAKEKAREKAKKSAPQKVKTGKSASVKQKSKRADPPKAKTIPMKDLCKLHAPVNRQGEVRIPVDQKFLAMVEKSYSGDLLANGGIKIREPFEYEGDFYVCLGGMSSGAKGNYWREVWRVVPANLFKGITYSYNELMAKWNKHETERGNHNGQRVTLKNKNYVLEGPKTVFYDPKLEETKLTPGVCRVCGCTKTTPCPGGCAWADRTKTLCTACRTKGVKEEIEALEREIKQEVPCLDCANDSDRGGNCHREKFYRLEDDGLVCDSHRKVQTSAKDKPAPLRRRGMIKT